MTEPSLNRLHRLLMVDDLRCDGIVVRQGYEFPCTKPAVAVVDDTEDGDDGYWPVCAYHANQQGLDRCVPIADLVTALIGERP